MKRLAMAIMIGGALPAAAFAQGGPNPVSRAIAQQWEGAKRNIVQSAEIMDEANYAYKPIDTVRSFGAILAHVAGANFVFCAPALGEASPHAEDEFENTAKTKAAIVKALQDSVAYCDRAVAALTDANAGQAAAGQRTSRAAAIMSNTGHVNEHYGNLVTYFRMKGIVPPSSRPRQ